MFSFLVRLLPRALAVVALAALAVASWMPASALGGRSHVATTLTLPNGDTATVYDDGVVRVASKDGKKIAYQAFAKPTADADAAWTETPADKLRLFDELSKSEHRAFAPNEVLVVYRDGVGAQSDVTSISSAQLRTMRAAKAARTTATAPRYTNDYRVNASLAKLGADRQVRLFRNAGYAFAMNRTAGALNPANAYRIHITASSVRSAVTELAKNPSVLYVSPNWYAGSMNTGSHPIPSSIITASRQKSFALSMRRHTAGIAIGGVTPASSSLPSNYGLVSSEESLWNSPSVDGAAAYDEIVRSYGQLPGQGETITNVSLGDIDDANTLSNVNDPCRWQAVSFGPTMHLIGAQHYMDWPSMPLIPTYVSDSSGNLSGTATVCHLDPLLVEIGLDFSMMAPLPHDQQRPGEQGSGLSDLLGIAPGAQYRLIVPQTPTIADVDTAFLAAAQQTPRPNVITASLGFGLDSQGYASRYLEEDPLTEAVVSSIVHSYNVVMCVSAGDGLRTATFAAIGPSGGSVALNTIAGGTPTDLNDVAYSGAPSTVFDSGAIAVGGTTLDDLSAMPPQDPQYAAFSHWHAFAATRWTGATNYSSAFGSRVNISAPGDNLVVMMRPFGGAYDSVTLALNGGTSASAPEVAASAAVALQVARLTGHPFQHATDVRKFLVGTATDIPQLPQADVKVNVGPQVDLTRAVEQLLTAGGKAPTPGVARVAVEQRRNAGSYDTIFTSDTDPSSITMHGPHLIAWITIAPDWENVPADASYKLYVTGHKDKVLATTRWARLIPQTILGAAGLPFVSPSQRTVDLTYEATTGSGKPVTTEFTLTFDPTNPPLRSHAAIIAPVTKNSPITVTYDLTGVSGAHNLMFYVSEPGHVNWATGNLFHPVYTLPLTALKGTIQVPQSALQGGGIYGTQILFVAGDGVTRSTDYAYTRVEVGNKARPAAPLLAMNGSTPGHFLEIPYHGSFQVSYDVSNVPGATGAMIEIAAPGPGTWRSFNQFNNPNGSQRDHNGIDSGSVYYAPLMGTSGTVTLNGATVGLVPTLYHTIRVLPTKFGTPTSEAGDVSTITMDGVLAADGGYAGESFGVNASGNDGYFASNQITASGDALGSAETFDQTSMGINATVDSGLGKQYFTNGWGAWGETGIMGIQQPDNSFAYNLLSLNTGTLGPVWNPPIPPSWYFGYGATNNVDGTGAFLAIDGYSPPAHRFHVFSSNLAANTFGSVFDISAPVASFGFPITSGIAQDGNLKTSIVVITDFANSCSSPAMIKTDLTSGTTTTLNPSGSGYPEGIAVDSQTHRAFMISGCDGGINTYDIPSGNASEVAGPYAAYSATTPIADEKHGYFLAMQATGQDLQTNNNGMGQLDVFDENGNLVNTIRQFNTGTNLGIWWSWGTHYLQLNPATRTLFFPGVYKQEIEPFPY